MCSISVTVTDEAMTCTHSPHWAWPDGHSTGWVVTWLDHPVDRNTAITALHLAELHSGGAGDERMTARQRASLAVTFAAELDLTPEQAATRLDASETQAQNLRTSERHRAVGQDC